MILKEYGGKNVHYAYACYNNKQSVVICNRWVEIVKLSQGN